VLTTGCKLRQPDVPIDLRGAKVRVRCSEREQQSMEPVADSGMDEFVIRHVWNHFSLNSDRIKSLGLQSSTDQ